MKNGRRLEVMEAYTFIKRHNSSGTYCPLCGSKKSEIIFTHARLANIKTTYASKESIKRLMTNLNTTLCEDCGMLFRNPLMSDLELKRYYEKDYLEKYKRYSPIHEEVKQESYEVIKSRKRNYFKRYFNFLTKNRINFQGKRVLDIGCGDGWFLAVLKEEGALNCVGIEPAKQHCNDIARIQEFDIEVLNGCVRDFSPEQLGKFDLITMIGVLEHLSAPIADLKVIKSFMSDNSYLYIYTHHEAPNLTTDIKKRISLVHQLYFTSKTIRILFKKLGFRIIDIKTRYTNMHILLQKCEDIVDFKNNLNRAKYILLKSRHIVNKNVPSRFYSLTNFFYRKCISILTRLNLSKIY